jgi:hypothetical protein
MIVAKGHRINVWFQPQVYARLQELQKTTAGLSKARVIHNALALYEVVIDGRLRGKDVVLVDRETGEKSRIVLL